MCRHELAARQFPAGKDLNTEAEESTLLGTITEQQLEKTITDGELACAVVRSRVRELARAL
jgi:hypothetical protein